MPSPTSLATVFAVSALATATSTVDALPSFLKMIPGSQNVKGVEAIGHELSGGGGARNTFGEAFEEAGKKWNQALCYKDSDNDGQFNGAELGDPCCEWVQDTNEKLAYTTATAPGDKASMQDPMIWATVKCADGSSPEAKFKAYASTTTAPAKETNDAPAASGPAQAATPAPTTKSAAATSHAWVLSVIAVVASVAAVLA